MKNFAVSAVVGMGLLIIIITVFIIYGLVQKSDDPDFKFFDLATESVPEPVQETTTPQPVEIDVQNTPALALGDLRYEIPAGFKVVDTEISNNRLILRLENQDQETRLMILNLNSGAQLGTITLSPAQAAQ